MMNPLWWGPFQGDQLKFRLGAFRYTPRLKKSQYRKYEPVRRSLLMTVGTLSPKSSHASTVGPSSFPEQHVKKNGNVCGVPPLDTLIWLMVSSCFIYFSNVVSSSWNEWWSQLTFTDFWDGWLNTSQFLSRHFEAESPWIDLAARSNKSAPCIPTCCAKRLASSAPCLNQENLMSIDLSWLI